MTLINTDRFHRKKAPRQLGFFFTFRACSGRFIRRNMRVQRLGSVSGTENIKNRGNFKQIFAELEAFFAESGLIFAESRVIFAELEVVFAELRMSFAEFRSQSVVYLVNG